MTESGSLRVGKEPVLPDIVFPVQLERRVFGLKNRLAWLAYKSRDPEVVRAASDLLVRLTELLEDLEDSGDDGVVLGVLASRLLVLEVEARSLLRRPELAHDYLS